MTSPLPANLAPLALARRIIELHSAVDSDLEAGRYESAAQLRDERELLERELTRVGSNTLIRNVQMELRRTQRILPIVDLLEPTESAVDESVLQSLAAVPVPVRWLIYRVHSPPVGALRKRLDIESLESAYFRARFPVISRTRLALATIMHEWIDALTSESARSLVPVVWICAETDWLEGRRLLPRLLARFEDPATEFVMCLEERDASISRRARALPGAVETGI